MKTIIKIAKTELRTLFYSPIIWFLMIAFLVQCGLTYTNLLERFFNIQQAGGATASYMNNITARIFLDPDALFGTVMEKLYLYIPLLTMGLISRETGNGTIRLLYSSPVKIWEIVLGKYVAMMVYSLIMVAIVGIFMIAGAFNIHTIDSGVLLSATLGFYLLLCTYSAIGLFMSCLTNYQVVAAISTFVIIAALSYVGGLWQDINIVRDLTYFLSLNGRAENLMNGLITSKDVLYFLLVSALFLSFSYFKLKAAMESRSLAVKLTRYLAALAIVLLAGYVSSRPRFTGYYDATANKYRTLTPNTQQIIKEMSGNSLSVTVFNNQLNQYNSFATPKFQNDYLEKWESYLRFKPDIKFNFVYYYDSTYDRSKEDLKFYKGKSLEEIVRQKNQARKLVDMEDIKTPAEIRKIIDLKPELNRFVVQLRYKNKTTFLRVFDDMMIFPQEAETAAALKRLLVDKSPKIVFLNGELERSIYKPGEREYKLMMNELTFRSSLVNQGFDVDTVSLQTQDIPSGTSTLVIADPKVEFSETSLKKIKQFIDNGGNLLITGEPGKQAMLNPLLQYIGVQMMNGQVVQLTKDVSPNIVLPNLTSTVAEFSSRVAKELNDSTPVSMPGATGLSWVEGNGFNVSPLLMTDAAHSWIKKDQLVADSAEISFSIAAGDEKKSAPLAVSLSRKINGKEQRIIVTGDADFISNNELSTAHGDIRTANFTFGTSLFSWLSGGEFPIDTSRPENKDRKVAITETGIKLLKIVLLWGIPILLLLTGSLLLFRRKRR